MKRIIFPLLRQMKSIAVADLQEALLSLLERSVLLANDSDARRELSEALRKEHAEQIFGEATSKVVGIFQDDHRLRAGGEVDAATASALNTELERLALVEPQDLEETPRFLDTLYTVLCRAVDARGIPIPGLLIEALAQHPAAPPSPLGEPATTDEEGMTVFRFRRSDFTEQPGETGPALYFQVYRGATLLEAQVLEIASEEGILVDFRPQREPLVLEVDKNYVVTGVVVQENGLPAGQLTLSTHHVAFGGTSPLLGRPTTDARGRYALAYDPGEGAVNLDLRVVDPADDQQTISLAKPRFAAAPLEVLNLVAPTAPLAAEYERLTDDLKPQVGELRLLAGAHESSEQQDLTVLHRATGWDARLIALAATSERLSNAEEMQLPQEAVYGLLRAGLPSDKLLLAQVEPEVIEQALKKVRDAGIIASDDAEISQFAAAFSDFSQAVRLNVPAPGTRSTYGDLLQASGLPEEAQSTFAALYFQHQGDPARLWEAAAEAGLEEHVETLQLQGKLAFLAGNSAELTDRLMKKEIQDPARLVEHDLHQVEQWMVEVWEQAEIPANRRDQLTAEDRQRLEALIPEAYVGEEVEDRLLAYSEDMARKVRLSYPTQVLGRRLETDDNFKLASAHDATVTLLNRAAEQQFRLGETPVAAFLRDHAEVTAGLDADAAKAAQQQLQMLQRVYQLTPDDESMPILMQLDITSAYDVMAYSEDEFISLTEAKYQEVYAKTPRSGLGHQIYRRAKQVSSVTYNLFTIAKKMTSEPPIAGLSAPVDVQESVHSELIKQFPTMESLFGSLDYCACEHCRSVLSPAAYLVDLLQFVDPEAGVWGNFLAHWKATHNNQDYPHQDNHGNALKPYDVLVERRPDLPHIALTCENTHTALPYIDLVNEILEYYVAHGQLTADAAHDTGSATTAELLAEPQNVIREAYTTLRAARYPLHLPFDLWIETVRQFCHHFETPLEQVLEAFRSDDELFVPAQPYDRAAIFMESLGLAPAEVAVFTNPDPLPLWYELYGFANAAQATTEAVDPTTGQRIDLNSAKALSRRLGVTYQEMAELVQTGFVNPQLVHLQLLYKLGVSIRDARFYQEHQGLLGQDPATLSDEDQKRQLELAAFLQTLNDHATRFAVPVAQLEAEVQNLPFGQILVLVDPDAGCNFDLTTLRFADGTAARPIDFLRLNLLVRLWRKLGWSLEETDRALALFIPSSAPFEEAHLAKRPLQTALLHLAHLHTLEGKVRVGAQARLKLLTLWSNLATSGKKPLYAQLFLTRGVLESAPVFDHPLGQYLADPNIQLEDHVLTVQGALGLTVDNIRRILADAGKSLSNAELSLPNISLLYRHGLLAKGLGMSVRELLALKQLSGLDPFQALHPDPLATLADDHPFSQTLRFIDIAEEVKESGLTIEDLEYLLRHRFDEAGKVRPDREATRALLGTLAEGVRSLRAEHAIPDDPGALEDEVLRQKLGLALPSDVVERFLAMMQGTVEFTATQGGVADANQLVPEALADEPAIRGIHYNATRQEQKLTFQGVLFDAQKADLLARLPQPVPPNPHVPSPLLSDLLEDVQQQARSFFDQHLRQQAPGLQPAYGFLEAADYDLLFDPSLPLGPGESAQDRQQQQRSRLAQTFLSALQERLIRQFVVQTMTAHTGADPTLVESLVADRRLLATADAEPLLTSFVGTGQRGVDAAFFDSDDLSGAAQPTSPKVRDVEMALKDPQDADGNPLGPANSARFEGTLKVPTPGAYRFFIELEHQDAAAELRFGHLPEPVFLAGTAATNHAVLGEQPNDFLELQPAVPYPFTLELKTLSGGGARLRVQGETLAKDNLGQLQLSPRTALAAAESAHLLLSKALRLGQGLGLNEREIRHLETHPGDFGNALLSQLPTQAVGDTAAENTATHQRFSSFLRLASYARLQRSLAGGTDDLIGVFEAQETGDLGNVYPLLSGLTGRDQATVQATAEALFAAPAFANEEPLARLWGALEIVGRFGVPAGALPEWTRIVHSAATPDQRFEIARDLKEAVQARFEPETWRRLAQPIFDRLRQRQRDALVSYVQHQLGFDRIEQLYEHFLIDPGMEPAVQTSRIRLAISSLQLLVQRGLLNLEPKVHPSVLQSKHWEWMKRYRVWEANRKIFLFPENWLEPEFRDDKTHLFNELEGALLEGDVSRDLAEDAFLNYLKKLDELARLDIVALHMEDEPDPARRTLHVFGRTYSKPHKMFYRRYAHQMWTPWEPVSAEIEGNHLAPVVWRDRLYLFWVTFLEKPLQATSAITVDPTKPVTIAPVAKEIEVQLHWSEYLQGEWSTAESNGWNAPNPILKTGLTSFDPRSVFIHVSKAYEAGEERGVFIHLGGQINRAFYLAGRNSTPDRRSYSANGAAGIKPENPYSSASTLQANRYSGNGKFKVRFLERIITEAGGSGKKPSIANPDILELGDKYTLLPCDNNLTALGVSADAFANASRPAAVAAAIENGLAEIASLIKPIFYQDNQHTLFIEPSVTEKTLEELEEWVARAPEPDPAWRQPDWWPELEVAPQNPWPRGIDPTGPGPIDPLVNPAAPPTVTPIRDWLVNPATLTLFDNVLIGPSGQPGLQIRTFDPALGEAEGRALVHVNSGSGLPFGGAVVLEDAQVFGQSGLAQGVGGLNVVGADGFGAALAKNFNESGREGAGLFQTDATRTGRSTRRSS